MSVRIQHIRKFLVHQVLLLFMILFVPVFLSSFYPVADTEVLKYEVLRNNKVIGHINAIKATKTSATEYIIESNVNFEILFDYSIYSFLSGSYSNGQLKEGKILRKVNGREKTNAHISWNNNQYIIQDGKRIKTVKEKIVFSTACLMNSEPVSMKKIFSENYQQFIPVTHSKPHEYIIHLPDGNKNYYSYENGICTSAVINTTLSTAIFRLKK